MKETMHDRFDDEDETEQDRIGRIFFDEAEHPLDQYRSGYPDATESELRMLWDAEKKSGKPPSGLEHAKIILADNVWIFRPRRRSPFGRNRADGKYFPTQPVQWRPAQAATSLPKIEAPPIAP
jgi:hypothetical protein